MKTFMQRFSFTLIKISQRSEALTDDPPLIESKGGGSICCRNINSHLLEYSVPYQKMICVYVLCCFNAITQYKCSGQEHMLTADSITFLIKDAHSLHTNTQHLQII